MPYKNAGFLFRFLARILDSFFAFLFLIFVLFIYSYFTKITDGIDFIKSLGDIITIVFIFVFLATLANLFYQIYFVSKFGGTLGKLLLGLQIYDASTNKFLSKSQVFFRSFAGYTISSQIFGYGYLRVLSNKSKLALHDELFGTKVLRVGSVWPGIILGLIIIAGVIFVVIPFVVSLLFSVYF